MSLANFPLTSLPSRKFEIGDRVVGRFPCLDEEIVCYGTVFGYYFDHPLWNDQNFIQRAKNPGWIYTVVYSEDLVIENNFPESELELLEDSEDIKVEIDKRSISVLFLEYPQLALAFEDFSLLFDDFSLSIEGSNNVNSIYIKCTQEIAAKIADKSPLILEAFEKLRFSQNLKFDIEGEVFDLSALIGNQSTGK